MAGDDADPPLAQRGLAKLSRKMKALAADIKVIRDKGVSSLKNSGERLMFSGMHAALEDTYLSFLKSFDAMVDYCTDHGIADVPTAADTLLLTQTKEYYYEAKGIHIRIEESKRPPPPERSSAINESTTSIQLAQPPRTILPKINIRPFNGTFSDWTSFKQLFESLIIKDEVLTNIQRFHFLISYVEGPAKDVIKAIEVTEANFTQAWEALCATYDNKRKIAIGYLDKLLSYKPNTGKPSAESLQSYISNVSESIVSLKNLRIANLSEYILCELALRCLDSATRQAFEISIVGTEFPTFTALKEFVQSRCQVLGLTQGNSSKCDSSDRNKVFKPNKFTPKNSSGSALLAHSDNGRETSSEKRLNCFVCKKAHIIKECPKFKSSSPAQRLESLKNFPGCRNCLFPFHTTSQCKSKFSCKYCNQRHHKDLHLGAMPSRPSKPVPNSNDDREPSDNINTSVCGAATSSSNGVLLGTVRAQILDSSGKPHEFRGILDQGSQFSFIVESAARKLGKSTKPFRGNITGVGSSRLQKVFGKINVTFQPQSSDQLSTEAIVVSTITPPLPQTTLSSTMWYDYRTFNLSDPEFNRSQPVSFLIGADLFPEVVLGAPIVLYENGPRLVNTVFGFSVIGRYVCEPAPCSSHQSVACLTYQQPDEFPIEKFWEIEEPLLISTLSDEDRECEEHFVRTHFRDSSGRYGVRLPFKPGTPKIVPNIKVALNRFYSLENKLAKRELLKIDYHAFMREYLQLGHMSVAQSPPAYVIPHHPVYKFDRQGNGKVRVVFDAGFITPTSSLNDHLFTGPKLQSDICTVVLNFRRYAYVLTCDIVKCFRQILVHPEDRKYQQIIWRFDPSEAVTFYELNTVTYGLRSSPYQSQRVILQLLDDEGEGYPLAAQALRESIYVDDCPCGADTPDQLFELKSQLIDLLGKGGFELGKWGTNYPPLLVGEQSSMNSIPICDEEEDCCTKILGMTWDPRSDTFKYDINLPEEKIFSKRNILSVIARLFDPLGYVAPIIFHAKTILQETWIAGIDWDDQVPTSIQTAWSKFIDDFHNISSISIPRPLKKSDTVYRLVGFSDASERGYAGVLYVHSTQGSHSTMNLIKSKTKLAPLKSMTIPRLELQGALLLAQLIKSVQPLIKTLDITTYFCFTDSQVVLAWLRTPTYQLKTFVANRTQQILEITPSDKWYHIKGAENPADCASRGTSPSNLLHHDLWWSGPAWCEEPMENWPVTQEIAVPDVPEMKPPKPMVALAAIQETNDLIEYMQRHSSFLRLIRVFGYIRRFIRNSRIPKRLRRRRKTGPISAVEFRLAHNNCVQLIQRQHFPALFRTTIKENLDKELSQLAVFIDHENLVRVGGRLSNAPLTADHRHPLLLPARSHFTDLVIDHLHRKNNHPGPTALLAFLRQQYWVPRARNLIRIHKMKCVTCTRYAKSTRAPVMGDLPSARVTGVRAFMNSGVDMAGPFICRDSERRNAKTHKSYLCLFTCLA